VGRTLEVGFPGTANLHSWWAGKGARKGLLLAYALAVLLTALGALEASVRLLGLAPPLSEAYSQFVPDEAVGFRGRPFGRATGRSASDEFDFDYQYNSLGFRDFEHSREKPAGVYRILVLGDSFTFGAGADLSNTYPRLLEQRLNERAATPNGAGVPLIVEVVNFGIPRYWTEPERLLLEREGLAFAPDLVVVGFVPNDVVDTFLGFADTGVVDGYLITREAQAVGGWALALYRSSDLWRLLFSRYIALRSGSELGGPKPDQVYRDGGFHEADWLTVERELTEIARLARSHSARACVVHLPQSSLGFRAASYPADRLRRFGQATDLEVIDTLPALREAAAAGPLYWPKDGHPNADGYRVIARTVADTLVARGMVP
jgi:lysophospholipase L1-like esterase